MTTEQKSRVEHLISMAKSVLSIYRGLPKYRVDMIEAAEALVARAELILNEDV